MPDPVWPDLPDRTCDACKARHVVVRLFSDGWRLCVECQQMPSRVEQYRTSKETR